LRHSSLFGVAWGGYGAPEGRLIFNVRLWKYSNNLKVSAETV